MLGFILIDGHKVDPGAIVIMRPSGEHTRIDCFGVEPITVAASIEDVEAEIAAYEAANADKDAGLLVRQITAGVEGFIALKSQIEKAFGFKIGGDNGDNHDNGPDLGDLCDPRNLRTDNAPHEGSGPPPYVPTGDASSFHPTEGETVREMLARFLVQAQKVMPITAHDVAIRWWPTRPKQDGGYTTIELSSVFDGQEWIPAAAWAEREAPPVPQTADTTAPASPTLDTDRLDTDSDDGADNIGRAIDGAA